MDSLKNNEKKQKWLKVLEYSLPALLTIFVYVFAMICKGIAPFGKESICYIDCSDGLIPAYTGLWDWLHGKGSFTVSFNLGAGGSLFSSFITNGFICPLSWLIGIFSRENIIFGISLLFIVRFALMATTAYICFKKCFPNVNKWTLLLFTMVWTFSGWSIIHFTNIGWLDIMTLFPLLILAGKKLVEKGKLLWFVICLSVMLILSYYITYMVLVGVVVVSTVYVFTACKKENRMKVASNLFYAIFISLIISFVTFIPSVVTSLGGHRFTDSNGVDKSELYSWFFSKFVVVTMFALPVVFFVRLMTKYKQDKRNVLFFMLSFIICGLGLIIEPINKMWHTGSYYCFPLRYGFVLIMIMIFASLYYIDKYLKADQTAKVKAREANVSVEENKETAVNTTEEKSVETKKDDLAKEEKKGKKPRKKYFDPIQSLLPVFMLFAVASTVMVMIIGVSADVIRIINFQTFFYYFLLFSMSYGAIELALRVKTDKLTFANMKGGILVFVLCAVQIVMMMVGYLGSSIYGKFDTTSQVQNCFKVDTSNLENGYKIKDKDCLYNMNFPYLMDYASMSTWIHISSEEQYQAYSHLGYNTRSTVLYSAGGTYMTDLLLGNKYVLSEKTLDENYYNFIEDFDYYDSSEEKNIKVHLYELKYEPKKAFTTNVNLEKLLEDMEDKDDIIAIQNLIYKSLFNQTEDIMKDLGAGVIQNFDGKDMKDEDKRFEVSLDSTQGRILYVNSNVSGVEIIVNGESYFVNQGLNDLGTIKSDRVVVTIPKTETNMKILGTSNTMQSIVDSLMFSDFDIARFVNVYQYDFSTANVELEIKKDKLAIKFNNSYDQKYLFVPFVNLANMNANVNGTDKTVKNAFYNFMLVEIEDADNEIEITYEPQLLKPCAIITIVAIVLFAIFCVLNHFFKLSDKKFVIWVGTIGACVILLAVGFLVYLKPFFNTFVILFS